MRNKTELLQFYYLVGFSLLLTAGNVRGQGLWHVADIFRILNHVEIPAIDDLLSPLSDNTRLQHANAQIPDAQQDIRLYIIDQHNPTVKHEINSENYANRITTTSRGDGKARDRGGITDGVEIQGVRVAERLKNVDTIAETDVQVDLPKRSRIRLKIIVHGWGESANKAWYAKMTAAYMLRAKNERLTADAADLKVLQVDWSIQAAAEYSIAARNTRRVGHYVGQFISDLYKDYLLDDIHVIGHSLGGHIAGFIGKEVLRVTGERIGRITALDPAGPLFEGSFVSAEDRLADSDAKLVDVVHTDGGYFGCKAPLGSVDFFPNGGVRMQPGCNDIFTKRLIIDDIVEFAFCSHTRSYKYFIESIGDKVAMTATKCDSWGNYEMGLCSEQVSITFGEHMPVNADKGSYFFKTNSEPPFVLT